MKYISELIIITFLLIANFSYALTPSQIKQIEEIAQTIAYQSNQNANAHLDDMTASFRASASGGNVRFQYVLRVKKGLSYEKNEYSNEVRKEIIPRACKQNRSNPAFDRGLSYTFAYKNTYGETLDGFTVNKSLCGF